MTSRRLLLLLAPAGSMAAHGLAYGPFGADHHDSGGLHAYLPFAAAIVVPAAIATLLWATTCRRGRALQLPRVRALVATQLGVFAAQEVIERVASRVSLLDLASQPAVRWGVALQFVTAATCVLAIRIARRTVSALLAPIGRADLLLVPWSEVVSQAGARRIVPGTVWSPPSRGPPVVAV
jgi:hypothetical protein